MGEVFAKNSILKKERVAQSMLFPPKDLFRV